MSVNPLKPFCLILLVITAYTVPVFAEYHVIVTHRDMLGYKTHMMMTFEEFRAEQKMIDLERGLMREAQELAEIEWDRAGRYPGRVLSVRQVKKGRSFFNEADCKRSLLTVQSRSKDMQEERRRQRIKRIGKDEWARRAHAHALLKSKLKELTMRELSRQVASE